MNSVGLHVFAQLLKVLPMDTFEAIAAKYPLKPCNSRKFTPRDYFTAMLFGQLSGASPLREVVLGMAIAGEKIVHTGAKFIEFPRGNLRLEPQVSSRKFYETPDTAHLFSGCDRFG